jgi:hypothetical protein
MPLPKLKKGERIPGSGRVKGQPNRVSVEVRTLVTQLLDDPVYQANLRKDFKARRCHPTIESLIWNYGIGKPSQPITVAGSIGVDVDVRLAEERRIFAQLDLGELEQLAAESQRLVDRAAELVKTRDNAPLWPVKALTDAENGDVSTKSAQTPMESLGSDNESSVNLDREGEDADKP